jgi:dipeptidyl aminopeptidase/acylaminoacyl peptidase
MKMSKSLFSVVVCVVGFASMAGCQQSSQATPSAHSFPTLAAASPSAVLTDAVPAATERPTPEASPLSISAMQAKDYPGSDLAIERTLAPGTNYSRYIASYDSDGLRLYGLLTVPTGDKPAGGWPIILLNHGYIPPAEYSTEQSYAQIVAAFARAGYILFKPDYRGNGNSPGTPTQVYISPDYVADSLNALASLKKYPDANPDRIGVWGHSMGGNITLHELVISHDIKAAVLMAGVVGSYSDILDWWRARVASGVLTTENDQQAERLVEQMVKFYGTPQTNPDYWNSIDPTSFIGDIQPPVLIQVGTNDTVVPPSFSQELANRLQQAGRNVDLHVYPGADHNLAPDTAAAVQEAIAFFDQHVK